MPNKSALILIEDVGHLLSLRFPSSKMIVFMKLS